VSGGFARPPSQSPQVARRCRNCCKVRQAATNLWRAAPAHAQSDAFVGPRVQVDGGYDQLDASDEYPDLPRHFDAPYLAASAGYDVRIAPEVIAGAELGFGKPLGGSEQANLGSDTITVRPSREWTGAVRIGVIVTPSTLVF
jgi:hypothetical protein